MSPRQLNQIERKALAMRWPIPDEARAQLVERQVQIATDPLSSAGQATKSFRALVMADALNLRDEQLPSPVQDGLADDVDFREAAEVRMELLRDPHYVEYLRQQAMIEDSKGEDPGAIRPATDGPLAITLVPGNGRPSDDGNLRQVD